jgi:hypothetical protein
VQHKLAHTQTTPITQPTGHDNPLPEIPRDIAGLPNNKSAQQTDENVHSSQERKRSDRGYVLGCESGYDAREDQCGEGEIDCDQRSTLGCLPRKQAFSSEEIPE